MPDSPHIRSKSNGKPPSLHPAARPPEKILTTPPPSQHARNWLVTCHLGRKTVCKCFTGNGLDPDYNPDYMSSGLSPDYYSTNYYIYLSDTSSQ
jgi:hypothetical protein